jgi:hypothetical protein
MTIRLGEINHRHQLAKLCPYTTAVEIGTHRGVFAEELSRVRDGGLLYCVDPWVPYAEDSRLADRGPTREDDMREAERLLSRRVSLGQVCILRATSLQTAVRAMSQGRKFQLVYIDGAHDEYSVEEDLVTWWPLLEPGGLLAGHDFICPGETANDGVQKAVLRFAAERGLDVYLVPENSPKTAGFPWSYYMVKN